MDYIVAFGIGSVLYSLIERLDFKFLLFLMISMIIFFITGILIDTFIINAFGYILIGVLFFSFNILPRILLPKHPIEAGGTDVQDSSNIVPIGIIDFCWLSIMAGSLSIISFFKHETPFYVNEKFYVLINNNPQRFYDFSVFFLGKIIDGIFILGGVLAASMTILWSGAIWQKRRRQDIKQYKGSTIAAIKMVVAFFLVLAAYAVWIAVPLFSTILRLLELKR
jgi:hypothetical protein